MATIPFEVPEKHCNEGKGCKLLLLYGGPLECIKYGDMEDDETRKVNERVMVKPHPACIAARERMEKMERCAKSWREIWKETFPESEESEG